MAEDESYEDEPYEDESYDGESDGGDVYDDTGGSADSFTETTHRGWGSRLREQAGRAVLGFVLFLAAFPVLFWNEGRAVDRAEALAEGKGAVVEVQAESVDPANNGELVYFYGDATTDQVLNDADFGIEATALKLRRISEMYQWREDKEEKKEKTSSGGEKTVTRYKYKRVWSEDHIDSGDFRKRKGHENPADISYPSAEEAAARVMVGAYQLSSSLVEKINAYQGLRLPGDGLPDQLSGKTVHRAGNGLYVGKDPAKPRIGDLKVRFEIVPTETEVSVISRQKGNRLEPYLTETGTLELLELGMASADLMFNTAEEALELETWVLRLVGLAMMAIGLAWLFKIFATVIDRIPFVGIHIGTLVELGTSLIAILIALPLALLTIAIAWFFVRPVLSIVLLVLGVGGFLGLRKYGNK